MNLCLDLSRPHPASFTFCFGTRFPTFSFSNFFFSWGFGPRISFLFGFQIEETLERLDLHLIIELWFTDQGYVGGGSGGGSDAHDRSTNGNGGGISCVSSRTLQLHFSPTKGLHYHLPVLFDYFHLAAVTVTIHASLIAIHQPYIK